MEKNKIGTITISVFKTNNFFNSFEIRTDDETILPVVYVIEDTLKKY